jgi:hypothetical protein
MGYKEQHHHSPQNCRSSTLPSQDLEPNHSMHHRLSILRTNYNGEHIYIQRQQNPLISGSELLSRLRIAAASIGSDELGFTPDQIGLHSARSGAAMAMYLAGVPVFTIMLLGRWSSDAFLRYIRKQVHEFSTGISSKMIQNENFYTVPTASTDDSRTPKHPFNIAVQNTSGLYFKDAIRPLVSIFQ